MAFFKAEKRPFEEDSKPIDEMAFMKPQFETDVRRTGMTSRNAVLFGASLISANLMWVLCDKLLLSLGVFASFVLVWFLILRLIQSRRLAPLNFIINFLIVGSVTVIPVVSEEKMLPLCLIPIATGMCYMGNECDEGRASFSIQPFLTIGYSLFACAVSALSYLVMTLFGVKSISVIMLISVAIFTLVEFIVDKAFNSEMLVSSRLSLSKKETPAPTREVLEGYVSARLLFVGLLLAALAAMLGVERLLPESHICYDYARFGVVVVVAVVFMLCSRKLRIWYEPVLALIMFLRADTLTIFLLAMVIDIMVTGFYLTTSRKELTMPTSKYFAGLPRILVSLTFFIVIAECCIK